MLRNQLSCKNDDYLPSSWQRELGPSNRIFLELWESKVFMEREFHCILTVRMAHAVLRESEN